MKSIVSCTHSIMPVVGLMSASAFGQELPCGIEVNPEVAAVLANPLSNYRLGLADYNLSPSLLDEVVNDVPIVAHVVRRDDGTGGVSATQLATAITTANTRYADIGVRFFLQSTNFIDNTTTFNTSFSTVDTTEERTLATNNRVASAVNIFFLPNAFTSWGYFPWMDNDWIVLRNSHITKHLNVLA